MYNIVQQYFIIPISNERSELKNIIPISISCWYNMVQYETIRTYVFNNNEIEMRYSGDTR